MKLKKILLCALCSTSLGMCVNVKPANALRCALWDVLNSNVTPLPTEDRSTNTSALMAQLEQVLQTVESVNELTEYTNKLEKLAKGSSLSASISQVTVPKLENITKGAQTAVDAYKGNVPGVETATVDFEKEGQVAAAVSDVAVVSNPLGDIEEQVAKERKNAYIQQATIDLLADVLVAKKTLADLKQADSNAQSSSSSGDTVGVIHVAARMKDYENQVQTLEHKIKALQNLREGINALKKADPLKDEISVGGQS